MLNSYKAAVTRFEQWEDNMADNRMKDDEQQRNMGSGGRQDQNVGQQSPGRGGQGGQQGQQGQQAGQHGQQGGQKGSQGMEDDDEFATGGQGQSGGQNRGGQNR